MSCSGIIISGNDVACRFLVPPSLPTLSPPSTQLRFLSFRSMATAATATPDARSFYDLLGIPETGTIPEIKQAYKQLARKYHPDISPPDRVQEYTKVFIRVQEAYETLSDPQRRAVYDRDMSRVVRLAFSARRRSQSQSPVDLDDKEEWRNQWQSQVSELKRRSTCKDSEDTSWGARMRRQRDQN